MTVIDRGSELFRASLAAAAYEASMRLMVAVFQGIAASLEIREVGDIRSCMMIAFAACGACQGKLLPRCMIWNLECRHGTFAL